MQAFNFSGCVCGLGYITSLLFNLQMWWQCIYIIFYAFQICHVSISVLLLYKHENCSKISDIASLIQIQVLVLFNIIRIINIFYFCYVEHFLKKLSWWAEVAFFSFPDFLFFFVLKIIYVRVGGGERFFFFRVFIGFTHGECQLNQSNFFWNFALFFFWGN